MVWIWQLIYDTQDLCLNDLRKLCRKGKTSTIVTYFAGEGEKGTTSESASIRVRPLDLRTKLPLLKNCQRQRGKFDWDYTTAKRN